MPVSYTHRLSYRLDLVLRRIGGKSVHNPSGLNRISPELVLRGPLTTEALISEIPDEAKAAAMPGAGGPPMY